jgi:hypothetical protein
MSRTPVVLEMQNWMPSAVKYMQPKVNDKGGKSINVISLQSNRGLHITLPLLLSWGISDFTDEKGESDGKYSISLQFPNAEYTNPESELALQKLKEFEDQIINDAVKNSEVWFGKKQSREITEYGYFPFLKYSKNKDTKQIDYSRPPSLRPKVPNYDNVWKVEVYDTKGSLLFPSDNKYATPIDFVPKQSKVACVIQCGGIWIGGKGWGLTWKLVQCVVKPQVMESVFGKCHIKLSDSDMEQIEKGPVATESSELAVPSKPSLEQVTYAENSDDEADPEPEPIVPVAAPVKKIIKKAVVAPVIEVPVPVVETPIVEPVIEAQAEPAAAEVASVAPKKKIIKKVVAKA